MKSLGEQIISRRLEPGFDSPIEEQLRSKIGEQLEDRLYREFVSQIGTQDWATRTVGSYIYIYSNIESQSRWQLEEDL